MMPAVKKIKKRRVGLLLVSGEERDHIGMGQAQELKLPEHIDLLNGEPIERKLVVRGEKGMIRETVKVFGRAVHSGCPYLGVNENHHMIRLLSHLIDHKSDAGLSSSIDEEKAATNDGTTLNVGGLNGGNGSAPKLSLVMRRPC